MDLSLPFVFLLTIITPVSALGNSAFSHSLAMQGEMNLIDELISLAGSATRSGNTEPALEYEATIASYGVEIITTSNIQSALEEFGMTVSSRAVTRPEDIPLPNDTSSVHWYKYSAPGFYNYRTGGNYDLVSITAVSWDDTNPYLHYDAVTKTNTSRKSYLRSVLEQSTELVISMAISEVPGVSTIMTLADIHTNAMAESIQYVTAEIAPNDLSVYWTADRTIRFWYAQSSGSGNGFGLWYVEEMITIETLSVMTV